jgi:hypothetical protein
MKIIDKTPFQNEKGEIPLWDRLQGTLKYGQSWYTDLQAQKVIIDQLNRLFEKGFVLIRNLTLPGSEIVEPIILIGPGGVYVIHVTHLRGQYEAKGDQWNKRDNSGQSQPAPINLMSRVIRLAKALERYLQIQGIDLSFHVEPFLIAADPGMHVDTMRPAVRVVQSDAIKQFAASLIQAPPMLRYDIYDLADRIVSPRPKSEPAPQAGMPPAASGNAPVPAPTDPAARAHAIFNANEQARPLNPSELSFALQDESAQQAQAIPENLREPNPAQPLPELPVKRKGMSPIQWAVLGLIVLVEFCILVGFAFLIFPGLGQLLSFGK